ncbi:hypothetical protein K438DRAFT_1752345 [Mycena galopus ATCC 62051]|nr:hypothetical protein K438DRAFT_1752345 [Mycena galopus ATCC 62051]
MAHARWDPHRLCNSHPLIFRSLSRLFNAVVLVTAKTRPRQDTILCHVFHPDGRENFINILSLGTVGLSKQPNIRLPDLTIVFAPTRVARDVLSRGPPTAFTIHVPLDDASERVGQPRFYEGGQETEWAAGRNKVAEANPEFVALHWTDTRGAVTYGQLDLWTNALATHLVQAFGVCPGDLVLQFFDKGVEMIVGIIALLKASAAYVPLDVRIPPERLRLIHRTTCAKLCLTTASRRDDTYGGTLCYLMFTSGSTGKPKGVMVTHSSMVSGLASRQFPVAFGFRLSNLWNPSSRPVLPTIENIDGLHDSENQFLGHNTRGHLLDMNYPLAVPVFPSPDGKEIRFQFQYNYEYLGAPDLDWIQEHLFSALLALMEHPHLSVASSNLFSPKEKQFVREIGVGSPPNSDVACEYFHCMVDDAAARGTGVAMAPTPPCTPNLGMDSFCYVMFTSGSSTGKSKGVLIDHSDATAYVANAATVFPLENARRFLHFSPWTFDQGLADLLLALPIGGTVILADMDHMLLDLTTTLNSCKADYTVLTPAVAYGPTESTVHGVSTSFKHSDYVPAYIVDRSMRLVPAGAVGELILAENHVARGYLDLPEETAAAFIKSGDLARFRSDGRIEYLGRKEGGYVKFRGLRIDVSEVEAVLVSVPETFAVVEVFQVHDQPHLVALVARADSYWTGSTRPSPRSPRTSALDFYLFKDMQWIALEAIPQAASNKFDRNLLRSFFADLAAQPGRVDKITRILLCAKPIRLPETVVEKKPHTIWSEVLGIEPTSVHDDFFNVGGDSLGVRNKECHLTIQEFYTASVIATLVEFIESTGRHIADDLEEAPVFGLVLPVHKYTGEGHKTPLWLFHCAEGVGHEVKGVILFDTFNTQGLTSIIAVVPRTNNAVAGWTFRGFQADTGHESNPGAKELQRLSERHTYHSIQHFIEPKIEVPVLLLRAGVRDTSDTVFFVAENGDDELNFFTRANIPELTIDTVGGAEHADMKDNFATPVVQVSHAGLVRLTPIKRRIRE